MASTANFNWTTPDDTDLVKDGAAAIRTLGSAIDTSLVDLKGGTTGQVLSKASNTDLDYSWTTPTDQTPLTTKGDLFTFTTVDARFGVGADGTVLTADSNEATGLKWASAASGGYTLLSTTSLSGSSTSITSISGSYTDLLISIESAGLQTTAGAIRLGFNTLGGNCFARQINNGGTAVDTSNGLLALSVGENCDTGVAANTWTIWVSNYAASVRHPVSYQGVYYSAAYKGMFGGGGFESPSAITSVQVSCSAGTFNAGSVKIYGVK